MFSVFSRSAGVAALSIVALGLAACGESSEEKASKQVCSATSAITAEVQKLQTLPISTNLPAEVKAGAETIDKSVGEIKDAAPNLETARKEEFQSATRTFQLELASLLTTTLGNAASGEAALQNAEPKIKSSLNKLGADYKQAFEALKCS